MSDPRLVPEILRQILDAIGRPEVDWRGIKGMRDVISHRYFDIDAEEVYNTCTGDIPLLKQTILRMLKDLDVSS